MTSKAEMSLSALPSIDYRSGRHQDVSIWSPLRLVAQHPSDLPELVFATVYSDASGVSSSTEIEIAIGSQSVSATTCRYLAFLNALAAFSQAAKTFAKSIPIPMLIPPMTTAAFLLQA